MPASQTFRSLRTRNARMFFVGLAISNIGTWMQFTAMSLLVYRLTGRGTDVGITLFFQFLPMLLLGAWAGAVADRVDKRRMAIVTQSLLAAQALLLGVIDLAGLVTLPVVYVFSLALGVIGALDNPARRGYVVELVEPADIPNALALNTAVMTGSRIFGPAIAAALVDPLGSGWLFIANGVSFLGILWPMVRADTAQLHPSPPAPRGGKPVREALRFVAGHRRLAMLFAIFTAVGTFAFNYGVSLLKIADQRFGDTGLFGWLLAITSVGSMAGSLITAGRDRVTTDYFLVCVTLLGVSGLALAWAPSLAVALIVAVPLGIGGAGMVAAVNGITQVESPSTMRGRMLALVAVAFLGSTPVGAPVTGWVADQIGAEWSLAYGSIIALVGAAVGALTMRGSGGGGSGVGGRRLGEQVPTAHGQPGLEAHTPTAVEHAD